MKKENVKAEGSRTQHGFKGQIFPHAVSKTLERRPAFLRAPSLLAEKSAPLKLRRTVSEEIFRKTRRRFLVMLTHYERFFDEVLWKISRSWRTGFDSPQLRSL